MTAYKELGADLREMVVAQHTALLTMTADQLAMYQKGVEDALCLITASATVVQRDLSSVSAMHGEMYGYLRKMVVASVEFAREVLVLKRG